MRPNIEELLGMIWFCLCIVVTALVVSWALNIPFDRGALFVIGVWLAMHLTEHALEKRK